MFSKLKVLALSTAPSAVAREQSKHSPPSTSVLPSPVKSPQQNVPSSRVAQQTTTAPKTSAQN